MEVKTELIPFVKDMGKRFGVDMYINGKELIIKGTQEKIVEILKEE